MKRLRIIAGSCVCGYVLMFAHEHHMLGFWYSMGLCFFYNAGWKMITRT